MTNVYYWQGVVGSAELLIKYRELIQQLLKNELGNGLRLKKLRDYDIYSVRINKGIRLLVTTIKDKEGRSHLCVLEEVLNHDYQKAHFLQPRVLTHYTSNKDEILKTVITREDFEKVTQSALPIQADGGDLTYQAIDYCNNSVFILNEQQNKMLSIQLPAVVSGMPGSGKSTTAILLIEQFLRQQNSLLPNRVLYVAESERLIRSMQELWAKHVNGDADKIAAVSFKTYQELLQDSAMSSQQTVVAHDAAAFASWWNGYLKKAYRKKDSSLVNSKSDDLSNAVLVYEEFRVMAAYSENEYLKLGLNQCHFSHRKEIQPFLYQALRDYQNGLNGINPDLMTILTQDSYALIVCDEAQNLSIVPLQTLLNLAENRNICYLMDSHQMQAQSRSIVRPWLLERLKLNHLQLPFSYRCPLAVAALAKEVIELKYRLTEGLSDKYEYATFKSEQHNGKEGRVDWINPLSELHTTIEQVNKRAVVIIAHQQDHDEVYRLFNKPIVCTPQQVAGLEIQRVLLFNVFSGDVFKKANRLLNEPSKKTSDVIHRSKHRDNNDALCFQQAFNQVFTCITRAMDSLMIWQTKHHDNERIIDCLAPYNQPVASTAMSTSSSSSSSSSSSLIIDPLSSVTKADEMDELSELLALQEELKKNGLYQQVESIGQRISNLSNSHELESPISLVTPEKTKSAKRSPQQLINDKQIDSFIALVNNTLNDRSKQKTHKKLNPFDKLFASQKTALIPYLLFSTTVTNKISLLEQIMTTGLYFSLYWEYLDKNKQANLIVLIKALDEWHTAYPTQPSPLAKMVSSKHGLKLLDKLYCHPSFDELYQTITIDHWLSSLIVSLFPHKQGLGIWQGWCATYPEIIAQKRHQIAEKENTVIASLNKDSLLQLLTIEGGRKLIEKFINRMTQAAIIPSGISFRFNDPQVMPIMAFTDDYNIDFLSITWLAIQYDASFRQQIYAFLHINPAIKNKPSSHMHGFFKPAQSPNDLSLINAIKQGGYDKAEYLIWRGRCDIDAEDRTIFKRTALDLAIEYGFDDIAFSLIEQGANIYLTTWQHNPLVRAVARNHRSLVTKLLEKGADINSFGLFGDHKVTALSMAIRYKHFDLALCLINNHADVNLVDNNGSTSLHYAISCDDSCPINLIEALIKKQIDINKCYNYRGTLLAYAIDKGRSKIARLLVKHGADIKQADNFAEFKYAIINDDETAISELISSGLNFNTKYETPLTWAINHNKPQMAVFMISQGIDVNLPSDPQKTPLKYASEKGYLEVVEALIAKGAIVNPLGCRKSPLHWAIQQHHFDVADCLIKNKANLNLENNPLNLRYAIARGDIDNVKEICTNKPQLASAVFFDKKTPLFVAVKNNQLEIARYLLKISVFNQNVIRYGDLEAAIANNAIGIVELLLQHFANANINYHCSLALGEASELGYLDIVRCLVKYGADINHYQQMYFMPPLLRAIKKGHFIVMAYLIEQGASLIFPYGDYPTALAAALSARRRDMVDYIKDAERKKLIKQVSPDVAESSNSMRCG